jgi:hypothetical protein
LRVIKKKKTEHQGGCGLSITCSGKVDVRLPGKMHSNAHGARPVHRIIAMIKWIRIRRLSIKNSLSLCELTITCPKNRLASFETQDGEVVAKATHVSQSGQIMALAYLLTRLRCGSHGSHGTASNL